MAKQQKIRQSPRYAILSWNPETLYYTHENPEYYCMDDKDAERMLDVIRKKKPNVRCEIFINVKDVENEEKRLKRREELSAVLAKLKSKTSRKLK